MTYVSPSFQHYKGNPVYDERDAETLGVKTVCNIAPFLSI